LLGREFVELGRCADVERVRSGCGIGGSEARMNGIVSQIRLSKGEFFG
jgi:hypothetical protein